MAKFKGTDVVFASLEEVEKVVSEKQAVCFVWRDEGEFINDKWKFNAEHHGEYEPLLIDTTTANAIMKLYNTLSDIHNKAKLDYWVYHHRGTFGRIVELTWEAMRKSA